MGIVFRSAVLRWLMVTTHSSGLPCQPGPGVRFKMESGAQRGRARQGKHYPEEEWVQPATQMTDAHRPIRDEQTVVMLVSEIIIPWYGEQLHTCRMNRDGCSGAVSRDVEGCQERVENALTFAHEIADDVRLYATINCKDAHALARY